MGKKAEQGDLPGMEEREKPNPLWKYVRKFESTQIVDRSPEEAIALGAGVVTRRLYTKKIVHTSEQTEPAACQTEAQEVCAKLLDDQVETFETFQATHGGSCKGTFSCIEVTPRKDV